MKERAGVTEAVWVLEKMTRGNNHFKVCCFFFWVRTYWIHLKNIFLGVYKNGEQIGNIYDNSDVINFPKALFISLIAILIVFVVLIIIIGAVKLMEVVYRSATKNKKQASVEEESAPVEEAKNTTIEDDDMMVAALIATIDYSNEVKTDVKLKSINRIG